MASFVISPPRLAALAVAGSQALFPVGRVFCIGRNYRWSADEPAPQEMPAWFMKPATAVVPAAGVIPYPSGTHDFCHEIELVVAIGQGGRDIDPAVVERQHIWGYAAGLDLTRRDVQQQAKRAGGPWEPAKAFDASAPCTPLVSAAVCGHPRQGAVWLDVNGSERQRADPGQPACGRYPPWWRCCRARWRCCRATWSSPARLRAWGRCSLATRCERVSPASASSR